MTRVVLPSDINEASQVFSRAFDLDPVWSFFCNDATTRLSKLEVFFLFLSRCSVGHGWLHATPQMESLCLWSPPNVDVVPDSKVEELLSLVPVIVPGREELLHDFFARVTEEHPHEPHWYLSLFATDTPHRGRGIGMSLLQRDLTLIDETGMPCYLESSNPSNEPRYQSVGFQVIGSFDVCDGGPPMVKMWRDGVG